MLVHIVISILFGFAAQSVGERGKPFTSFLSSGSEVMMKVVSLTMYLAPIGLGAYFATLVGQYGPILLGSYIKAGITYYVASIVYFFVAFTIYAFMAGKGQGIRVFWSNMLIDPPATMLNASGDNVAGMMVSRMVEGRNWLKKDGIK